MLRSAAVTRIQDGLGFATRQEAKIILRLQEAQRELERGKTLPRFLLQENQPLVLLAGSSTITLPAGFLRLDDSSPPYFISSDGTAVTFISIKRELKETAEANFTGEAGGPKVAFLQNTVLNFVTLANTTYNMTWNYYKAAALLTTDVENEWLANAPEWLIGEAGWRMAMDARDKDATTLFDTMRKTGRAATFGEVVAFEESSGPLIMGANL